MHQFTYSNPLAFEPKEHRRRMRVRTEKQAGTKSAHATTTPTTNTAKLNKTRFDKYLSIGEHRLAYVPIIHGARMTNAQVGKGE